MLTWGWALFLVTISCRDVSFQAIGWIQAFMKSKFLQFYLFSACLEDFSPNLCLFQAFPFPSGKLTSLIMLWMQVVEYCLDTYITYQRAKMFMWRWALFGYHVMPYAGSLHPSMCCSKLAWREVFAVPWRKNNAIGPTRTIIGVIYFIINLRGIACTYTGFHATGCYGVLNDDQ